MLRHFGLAVVAVSLVAVPAGTVHARGGARSGGHWRTYNFGSSFPGNVSNAASNLSPHFRGASGTSRGSARNNAVSGTQTVLTPTVPTKTLTTTTGTSQQTTTSTNAGAGSLRSQLQQPATTNPLTTGTVTNGPLAITPSIGISLDPNAAAQRTYGPLLHNAKLLIKAGIYGAAANDLQRIINGAAGTRIAAQAQRLLASIPQF